MYWKNFSKIVATFTLVGPLAGTAPIWLILLLSGKWADIGRPKSIMIVLSVGFAFGFPFAFLTGALFAFLALFHNARHLVYAWFSALAVNVFVAAGFAMLDGRHGAESSHALQLMGGFLVPSLLASTFCWFLVARWIDPTSAVTAPERADQ